MTIKQFSRFPAAYVRYAKIAKHTLFSRFNPSTSQTLPQTVYQVNEFQVDQAHLQTFRQICGYHEYNYDHHQIPAIYLLVLAQRLQMVMMTEQTFPFSILGLVHTANHITQHRPILTHEKLTLSCQFGELHQKETGVEFEFLVQVCVNQHPVLEATTCYFVRQAANKTTTATETSYHDYTMKHTWYLSESLGRRYALISGDFNPIHLHQKTAQFFKFKQAIIHGMWTHAKVAANLTLPPAYTMNVTFKRPIFLPSKVDLMLQQQADRTQIILRSHDTHQPHLMATLCPLDP